MIRFQLEIAVVLAASVLGSIIVSYWTRTQEGKIQLPIHADEFLGSSDGRDPLDVTKPDDIIDGYPIDEGKFWIEVRLPFSFVRLLRLNCKNHQVLRRKLILTANTACIVALSTICLGYAIANAEPYYSAIYSVYVGFATYLLVICALSLTQSSTDSHRRSILHIVVLSTIAATAMAVTAVIPRTTTPVVSSVNEEPLVQVMWYIVLVLLILADFVALTTSLGPPLHYPPEKIYSEKTVMGITNPDLENVCGMVGTFSAAVIFRTELIDNVGCSAWSYLLFSYTTKVVWLGNVAESLDIGDLPVVPGDTRATYNFSRMRQAMRSIRLSPRSWRFKPGSGWQTAYQLVRVNATVLLIEILLAALSAVFCYVPTIFLQRLIHYFEADPTRQDTSWGWAYVFGMIGSNIINHLGTFRFYRAR